MCMCWFCYVWVFWWYVFLYLLCLVLFVLCFCIVSYVNSFVCTSVKTTATEWKLNCSNNNSNNNKAICLSVRPPVCLSSVLPSNHLSTDLRLSVRVFLSTFVLPFLTCSSPSYFFPLIISLPIFLFPHPSLPSPLYINLKDHFRSIALSLSFSLSSSEINVGWSFKNK